MKIKELRELIATMQDDDAVSFEMLSGCCGDYEDLDLVDAWVNDSSYKNRREVYLRIEFAPLPGYRSCIQTGGTKRAHDEYWKQFDKPKSADDSGEKGDSN